MRNVVFMMDVDIKGDGRYASSRRAAYKYSIDSWKKWCDKNNCELIGFDPKGLGQGRIFSDEENKCDNIGQPNVAPNGCAKPEDNLRYYGSQKHKNNVKRQTVQGGGEMLEGGDSRVYN